jgi:dTDP-4-amino-4,6-dideoxygalactose transaminase
MISAWRPLQCPVVPTIHRIPLLDLQAQHAAIGAEVMAEIARVVDSQQFILGPHVAELETRVAEYCGARHAVGCASGSDALYLALLALGVGHGDKVITAPFTFFATGGAIVRAGATPVFVDIDPATFNMDAGLLAETLDRHPGAKAMIPVHLYGACADMDAINRLAAKQGIPVIEDAAQSIGAEYQGRRAGSLGRVACFSFFPSKNLGGYGDGGMLTTNDADLAGRLRMLRVHGSRERYIHEYVGINSRLDSLQAAVLCVKLRHLDAWTARRQENAALYRQHLAATPVTPPAAAPHTTRHVYNQFVIRAPRRDELRGYLTERGIGTEIYYPIPLHLQTCFASLGHRRGHFPVAELAAAESLALPIYPELTPADIGYLCKSIAAFYR